MPQTIAQIIAHLRAVSKNPSVSTTLIQTEDLMALCDAAEALEPFTKLGGPNDGVRPAYPDLPDDVVVYLNSGECITAGDVRSARRAYGILHAPWRIPE